MAGPLLEAARDLLGQVSPGGPNNVMACCPFHVNKHGQRESHPSFGFNTYNGLWNCYSCGERGNLRQLLFKLGVGGDGPLSTHWQSIIEELKARAPLHLPREGYWLRPFPEDKVIPESSLGLFMFAPKQMLLWGFQKELLRQEDVGYDRHHRRITFPLRDYIGQLVGFSGRALLEGDNPRYKVYDQKEYAALGMPLLDPPAKGQLLWGYHQAVAVLQQQPNQPVVWVEGFKARLWCVQHGLPATIALLGSSMSEEQQHLLERIGGTHYLFLDNDGAGEKKYAIASRLSKSSDIRIPIYQALQPDALSPGDLFAAIHDAPSYLAWKLRQPSKINPYTYRKPT